jgi:hypothetical protein
MSERFDSGAHGQKLAATGIQLTPAWFQNKETEFLLK